MQPSLPEDGWFDSEHDFGGVRHVPLHTTQTTGRDLDVVREGPSVVIWRPRTGLITAILLFFGTIAVAMSTLAASFGFREVPERERPLFVLGLLFVGAAGVALWVGCVIWRWRQFIYVFDQSRSLLTARSRQRTLVIPFDCIESVEYLISGALKGPEGLQPCFQVNLVFKGMRPRRPNRTERSSEIRRRKNLSCCADGPYLKRQARELAALLNVPFLDTADLVDLQHASRRYLGIRSLTHPEQDSPPS